MTFIAEFMKYLRRRAGYTREEAAEKLQVTFFVYTLYESGKLSPSLVMLEKLGELYHVPFENMVSAALRSEKEVLEKKAQAQQNDVE